MVFGMGMRTFQKVVNFVKIGLELKNLIDNKIKPIIREGKKDDRQNNT